ncbi:thiol reductant ABC exporter subunit CydD [Enteractinococcus fodinae]|uniref:ATP-binding cassette subfamily C protein CydCD n=1 Tax=Enteractinococcus fodinae TaxID=684663 RepID=A0ABU2B4E0_9MICC|nr:thiol reductant ABC exporter subunit CydC [Enteractinococcus fodinae]MDR7347274.1 ATP-binding cassette subfamily C protein CydCD [Enteractinococcus fodinae]
MIPELPSSKTGRRALLGLGVLAAVKLIGWILIATSLARGISHLASALPASDAAQLLQLLFNSPKTAPGLIESLIDHTTSSEFLVTLALGFGGAILRGIAQWGQQVLATRAALGEKEQLRAQLVRHRLAAAGAHADRAGEDTVLASKGLDGLDDYYTDFLPSLVSALVIPLGLGLWILLHDWISAAVLVLTIPLIPMFMILIGKYTEHRVDEAAEGLNRLSHHLLELARGLPVLVGLRRAGTQRKALQEVSAGYQRTTMNTLKAAFMSGLALELISTLSVAIIAVFIGVRLVNGSMDLYAGIMVLTLAAEVYLPFRNIGSAYHASEDGVEALKRARAHINQPVPATLANILDTAAANDDRIVVDDLTIAYKALRRVEHQPAAGPEYLTPQQYAAAKRDSTPQQDSETDYVPTYEVEELAPVVQSVSMHLRPGQYTVMGDASGTGKSTILKALAGLLTDAEAVFTGSVGGLAGRPVAYLAQHPAFVSERVDDELTMVGYGTIEQLGGSPESLDMPHILMTSLRAAGLERYEHRRIDELSPGERRRLGFARVLARLLAAAAANTPHRAWFLVFDEPTAHLDHASANRIRTTLRALAQGRLPDGSTLDTILLVASHDALIHADAQQLLGQSIATPTRAEQHTPQTLSPSNTAAPTGDEHRQSRRRVTVADWWRVLPLNNPKFLGGIGWAVAALLSAALLSALSGWLIVQASYEPPILYLLAVIVGVRFFGIGRAVFRYAERLTVHDAVLSWANRIRLRVWDALGSQATQWHKLTRSGGALSVLISDVDQLRDAVPRVLVPIPAALITWATATGIVAFMAPGTWWPAAVAGLAAFVVVPIVVHLVDARTSAHLADHRTGLVSATSRLLTAAADMAGNGMAQRAANTFITADRQTTAPLKRSAAAAGLGEGLTSLIAAWAAVQTMWVAITNGISAPNTALVVMLMLAMAEPFGLFNQATQEARVLNHQLGKLLPLLDTNTHREADWIALEPTASSGVTALNLQDVTVSYSQTQPAVLDHFSLHATTGDFVVVTGPSGAGKSTLLAVLLGFLAPQAGTYRLTADAPDALNALQHVAWCPQEAYLFDSTLRSNLALARDPAHRPTDEECQTALETVGLGEWLANAPAGLDARLGPSGHFISGGQRQRVAVARALLADAQVILLDEPTAHLGADESAELLDDLKIALRDKIVVMVTHDRRFADTEVAVQL